MTLVCSPAWAPSMHVRMMNSEHSTTTRCSKRTWNYYQMLSGGTECFWCTENANFKIRCSQAKKKGLVRTQ